MALNQPPLELSSEEIEDRLAPLYQKLGIPFGTLEKLSGVKNRYLWEPSILPSQAGTIACQKALELSSVKLEDIGAVISCSVTRDYFEPAVASLIHLNLGLRENSISFDISNACIGFSDGMTVLANMIESGAVKAGIVVSAETTTRMIENCITHLMQREDISRDELLKLLPTLTLGCSAVAFVMTHESISNTGHKLKGVVCRSASQHSDLCVGDADYAMSQGADFNPIMRTESSKLISSAAKLGGRTWKEATEVFGWSKDDVDHIFCHQVGKQVNDAFYKEMGLAIEKEFTIYKRFGNPVSAALPTALVVGAEEKPLNKGDKVLLTAFGSGLNCRFIALEW